jgi:hypothetical protein
LQAAQSSLQLASGHNLLGLHKGRLSPSTHTRGLGIVGLHVLQAFLVPLRKRHVPGELGLYPLKRFTSFDEGFLMPILCHFQDQLCVPWFLDLVRSAPKLNIAPEKCLVPKEDPTIFLNKLVNLSKPVSPSEKRAQN